MQAMQVLEYGGPEAMQLAELDTPEPGPGQVRIEVEAIGVNFIDTYQRSGIYKVPLPFVAGGEGAGSVSALGAGVSEVAVGDRVAWAGVLGSYAEQLVAEVDVLVPVPEGVSAELAAASMLQGMTAQYLITSTYPVSSGQTVLIHAGAGGVGLLLTQMAKLKGARVITTVGGQAKAELSRGAGADEVILYNDVDFAAEVNRLTDGAGVPVVYDGVGASTFDAGLDCLARRGYMVLFGAASGPVPPVDPQTLNAKGSLYLTRPTLGDYQATRDELLERAGQVFDWIAQDKLNVRIGGRYPLEQAAQAHTDLAGRKTTGKLLLIP